MSSAAAYWTAAALAIKCTRSRFFCARQHYPNIIAVVIARKLSVIRMSR